MLNAADKRQVKKAGQRARLERKRELDDLRAVLATPEGRRLLWRHLAEAGVFRLSFAHGEADTTAFNEGRRSVGLALMADIHALEPSYYLTMATEAAAHEATDEPPAEDKNSETEEMLDV